MPHRRTDDPKRQTLAAHGTLHARGAQVTDELFLHPDFFDARDLLQVKYEMLRRVRVEGLPLAQVARRFALSRPAFYKAQHAFAAEGLWGLLPQKRGPRRAHKLSARVMAFIIGKREETPSRTARDLARLVHDAFALRVHPRTITRALGRASRHEGSGRHVP